MLSKVIDNTFCCSLDNGNMLREVAVKIGLERINTQEGMTVEVLIKIVESRLSFFFILFFIFYFSIFRT